MILSSVRDYQLGVIAFNYSADVTIQTVFNFWQDQVDSVLGGENDVYKDLYE